MSPIPTSRRTTLPQFMLGAYLVALVYGTLYPWTGWRWVGWAAFGFVTEPWPRWWTAFDVVANVASYAPLGALSVLASRRRGRVAAAFTLALASACALSFALEALQSHLPARVPSRLDWVANTAGAALGAGLAAWMRSRSWSGWPRWRAPGAGHARVDALGATLLATWLVLPAHQQRPLFGTADLAGAVASLADHALTLFAGRSELAGSILAPDRIGRITDALRLGPELAVFAEAAIVASAIVAIGLVVREMFPPGWPRATITAALVVGAALVKTAAQALLPDAAQPLSWMSAGAQGGLVLGAVLLSLLAAAWRRTRLKLAIAAVCANVAFTTAFPVDAYHESMAGAWMQGAWRNFDGIVQALAFAWPLAACAWCSMRLSRARERERG